MKLIIVESPTKARTFNYLLKDEGKYLVYATKGHIRDLPKNHLAIDYKNNFKPQYEIISTKKKIVEELKKIAQKNDEIILATDPDREGESIAYHIAYILGKVEEKWPQINLKDKNIKRIVFHEITKQAINEALAQPTTLRLSLVNAQQSRRILDRIVGYELSPLLWKKTGKNWLSAGRVQTVALRIIVEREKEINQFLVEDYYEIYANFQKENLSLKAKLVEKDNQQLEIKTTLHLFVGDYTYSKTKINKENLIFIKNDLKKATFQVEEIDETITYRYPPPPLTTSLLQQEAFNKFGFSSKMTMSLAQNLYEKGLITYHRTDSFALSTRFVFQAKEYIEKKFGKEFALEKPRSYKIKSKMAQEAHEAIRPTKLRENIPQSEKLTVNHKKLYRLIFDRALASQIKEATIKVIKIKIKTDNNYRFLSENKEVIFPGFLIVLNPSFKKESIDLSLLKPGDFLKLVNLNEQELKTKPPPRFTEAFLIKVMEEKGIGRPSTYSPIINLIQTKNYIEKDGRYFLPTPLGVALSDYLSSSFSSIFDLNFTSKMEDELDAIASNEKNFIEVINDFYQPFEKTLNQAKENNSLLKIEEKSEGVCPLCGGNLIFRYSKFGKFIACLNYPKCKYTQKILKTVKDKKCPKCQGEIVIKYTKTKKRFYGCINYPKCDFSTWKISDL